MQLKYYPETDSLYIELRDTLCVETREPADGVNIDFDANGAVIGIDIDRASKTLDLAMLDSTSLQVFDQDGN